MFVFYDLNDLILLHRLQVLGRITATGVNIVVPALREASYSVTYWMQIKRIAECGHLIIKDQEMPLKFISENERKFRMAGRSLLMLLHFCLVEHAILVLNDEDELIKQLCAELGVQFYTLHDFNIATINNKEYFDFITEIKKEQMINK